MSTPINTLPLKTQHAGAANAAGGAGGAGATDMNDINDPIVQDVLNEFQEELMISKQPKSSQQQQSQYMPQMLPPHSQHPQHPPHPQHPQYPPHQPHMPPSPYPSHQSPMLYPPHNSKYDNISSYLDTDVAKKSLILVILAIIIYHSGIINTVYEKMPDYLQENLTNFDIYIKSISLFTIIYVLSFFEYI
jgi:hypothetical protein